MPRGGARPGAGRPKSLAKPPKTLRQRAKAKPKAAPEPKPQARGGARPGAGKKSITDPKKKTVAAPLAVTLEVLQESRLTGETPLQYMLRVMRTPVVAAMDEHGKPVLDLSHEDRRDRMAIAAAPYLHPRLSGVAFQMAPPPSAQPGSYQPPALETEDTGALEIARRVAFTLALGHQAAKKQG